MHLHVYSCWLQYTTNFVWSFIAPVIVIILVRATVLVYGSEMLVLLIPTPPTPPHPTHTHQINFGFFLMVIVILYKQRKKVKSTSKLRSIKYVKHNSKLACITCHQLYRSWLKSSISLLVVMGLTWIVGILCFGRDLLAFAYIFTILVAFQV